MLNLLLLPTNIEPMSNPQWKPLVKSRYFSWSNHHVLPVQLHFLMVSDIPFLWVLNMFIPQKELRVLLARPMNTGDCLCATLPPPDVRLLRPGVWISRCWPGMVKHIGQGCSNPCVACIWDVGNNAERHGKTTRAKRQGSWYHSHFFGWWLWGTNARKPFHTFSTSCLDQNLFVSLGQDTEYYSNSESKWSVFFKHLLNTAEALSPLWFFDFTHPKWLRNPSDFLQSLGLIKVFSQKLRDEDGHKLLRISVNFLWRVQPISFGDEHPQLHN